MKIWHWHIWVRWAKFGQLHSSGYIIIICEVTVEDNCKDTGCLGIGLYLWRRVEYRLPASTSINSRGDGEVLFRWVKTCLSPVGTVYAQAMPTLSPLPALCQSLSPLQWKILAAGGAAGALPSCLPVTKPFAARCSYTPQWVWTQSAFPCGM